MRVTEQIDALTTLSTDPLRYLVLPAPDRGLRHPAAARRRGQRDRRDGRLSGGRAQLGFGPVEYLNGSSSISRCRTSLRLAKAAVFGFIIALMGCYHGNNSEGGAQGVGMATTRAVVSASILILTANTSSRGVLQPMSSPAPKIRIRGCARASARTMCCAASTSTCRRASRGGDRRSGTGKSVLLSASSGCSRPMPAPSRSTARRWWAPARGG
jgi:hypothetical protein